MDPTAELIQLLREIRDALLASSRRHEEERKEWKRAQEKRMSEYESDRELWRQANRRYLRGNAHWGAVATVTILVGVMFLAAWWWMGWLKK